MKTHSLIIACILVMLSNALYGQLPDDGLQADGSQQTTVSFYLSIPDTTVFSVQPQTSTFSTATPSVPQFSDNEISAIFSHYTVTGFVQAFPNSHLGNMRSLYKVTANSAGLADDLKNAYPEKFPYSEPIGVTELSGYTPNDFIIPPNFPVRPDYLEYIDARSAWGYTHGDPNVVIGITDTYLDTAHEDLQFQMAQVDANAYYGPEKNHGTQVSGAICARTDNGKGYPAIGFNCRLHFSSNCNDGTMLAMSQASRRILNASWRYGYASTYLDYAYSPTMHNIYREIYENGTFTCVAAGNSDYPWTYVYPASCDYVFSTSGVGWENDLPDTFNVKHVHEINRGDTLYTHRHNTRVDLLAPSIRVGTLNYNQDDPDDTTGQSHYQWDAFWGTSIASPQVAGTAGLMLSLNKDLSPYQLEYLLKLCADTAVFNYALYPENVKYAGRLGSGELDAGETLKWVKSGKDHPTNKYGANFNATQTFFIEGIDINTVCAPGYASNGAKPKLKPRLKNGTGPYTYCWEAVSPNTAILDHYDIAQPQILSSSGANLAYFRLHVYDNSAVQKVATKDIRIQLRTANDFDIAMRDSWVDMLDEPNSQATVDDREWDIWKSPDLWNRQQQDGVTTNQNPEYSSTVPNYVYVRIRNVGCAASPAGNTVQLYWTKSSTGEKWAADWTTTLVAGSGGGVVPGGLEITAGGAVPIPVLQPGQAVVLNKAWFPPNPTGFLGSPTTVDACLLARIHDETHGMAIAELYNQSTTNNIRNNNNIVTTNMLFTDLSINKPKISHQVDFANAESITQAFNLQFITDRYTYRHFSGDFSSVGTVILKLGSVLFNRWISAGAKGNYSSIDHAAYTVTYDASMDFAGPIALNLDSIPLTAGERFPVTVEFELKPGAVLNNHTFNFSMRQFRTASTRDVYGNVDFVVNTVKEVLGGKSSNISDIEEITEDDEHIFSLYPNPANKLVVIKSSFDEPKNGSVAVYDLTGRQMILKEGMVFSQASQEINISTLTPGVYFVVISTSDGISRKYKLIKE